MGQSLSLLKNVSFSVLWRRKACRNCLFHTLDTQSCFRVTHGLRGSAGNMHQPGKHGEVCQSRTRTTEDLLSIVGRGFSGRSFLGFSSNRTLRPNHGHKKKVARLFKCIRK